MIPPLDRVGANLSEAFRRAETGPVRRVPRRRLLIATGLAALVLLAAVPAYISLGGHRVASLSTAEALDQVAAAAQQNPLPFADEDQFLYTRSRGMYVNGFVDTVSFSALVTNDREVWTSVKELGVLREKRVGVRWVTERDQNAARRLMPSLFKSRKVNYSGLGPMGRYPVGSEVLTREEVLKYPTDPREIFGRIKKGLGDTGQNWPVGVWESLTGSLYELSLPAGLRAGMVQALGFIPGVRSLGEQRDALGRAGLGFERVHGGVRDVVLFDSRNSMVLSTRSEIMKTAKEFPDWPVGTTIASYLQYEQEVVDRPPPSIVRRAGKPHLTGGN